MYRALICKGCREYARDCECGPVDAEAADDFDAPEADDDETPAGYSVMNDRGQVVVGSAS